MSDGQHVGKLADSVGVEHDDLREMSRAKSAALARLAKPIDRPRAGRSDLGDGDQCPAVDDHGNSLNHGKMFVYGKKQWCPHSDHDGKRVEGVMQPRTRCWFPLWMGEEAKAS